MGDVRPSWQQPHQAWSRPQEFHGYFDVHFDPVALAALRRKAHRGQGMMIAAFSSGLVVLLLAIMGIVAITGEFAPAIMVGLIYSRPVLVVVTLRLAIAIANRRLTGAWLTEPPLQGTVALRLSDTGVWVAGPQGGITYTWAQFARVKVGAEYLTDPMLVIVPHPGVVPDDPVLVGFEGTVDPLMGIGKHVLRRRGPRFLVESLAVPTDALDAAVRDLSGGRFTLYNP